MRRLAPILAVLAVVLGLLAVVTRVTSFSDHVLAHNDLTQDYVATRAWADGTDPYQPTQRLAQKYLGKDAASYEPVYPNRRNPHPPLEILLVRPFGALDYTSARLAWLVVMAAMIATAVFALARGLGWTTPWASAVGIGTLALPIAQQDLIWAQINGFLLVLVVWAWLGLRDDREIRSGLLLGLATALKFYPAFFVIGLVRSGKRRAAITQVLSAALFTLVGVAVVGIDATRTYLVEAAPENFAFWRSAPMNLSLVATPFRWLTQSVWRPDGPDIPLLAGALVAIIILGCLAAAATTPARASGDRFWAVVPWMLLAAPLMWSFTLALTIPVLIVMMVRGVRSRGLPHLAVLVPAVVVAGSPIPGLPTPGPDTSIALTLMAFGLPTYALLALGVSEWLSRERLSESETPLELRPRSEA